MVGTQVAVYLEHGQITKAIVAFEREIEEDPDRVEKVLDAAMKKATKGTWRGRFEPRPYSTFVKDVIEGFEYVMDYGTEEQADEALRGLTYLRDYCQDLVFFEKREELRILNKQMFWINKLGEKYGRRE